MQLTHNSYLRSSSLTQFGMMKCFEPYQELLEQDGFIDELGSKETAEGELLLNAVQLRMLKKHVLENYGTGALATDYNQHIWPRPYGAPEKINRDKAKRWLKAIYNKIYPYLYLSKP